MKKEHHYYACTIAKNIHSESGPCEMDCTEPFDTIKEAKSYFEFLKENGWDLLATWIESYDNWDSYKPRIICFKSYINVIGGIHPEGRHIDLK